MLSLNTSDAEYREILARFDNSKTRRCISIPFSDIDYGGDYRVLGGNLELLSFFAKCHGVDVKYTLDTDNMVAIIFKEVSMTHKFTIEIPYGTRSKYIPFIEEVNELIEREGVVQLYISNNPYRLESFLVVETNKHGDEMKTLIQSHGMKVDISRGMEEFNLELMERRWDTISIAFGIPNGVETAMGMYHFVEEDDLTAKGYGKVSLKRKKVFISYSHNDAVKVRHIADVMQSAGLNIWIDTQELDAGDNILEKVLSGIDESDLHIILMSKSTLNAKFAGFELKTIWQKMIYNSAKWFLVRLDDVNPNDIYPSLGQYLYYDYKEGQEEELINALKKKLEKA